jgi:hypothetical protein
LKRSRSFRKTRLKRQRKRDPELLGENERKQVMVASLILCFIIMRNIATAD